MDLRSFSSSVIPNINAAISGYRICIKRETPYLRSSKNKLFHGCNTSQFSVGNICDRKLIILFIVL